MKVLTTFLKISVIVLNTVFLSLVLIMISRYGAQPRTLDEWIGLILMLTFPFVTPVTIALTFLNKIRTLTFVLKISSIILNASFLIIFIYEIAAGNVYVEGFTQSLMFLVDFALPVINVVAIGLTFRKLNPPIDEFKRF